MSAPLATPAPRRSRHVTTRAPSVTIRLLLRAIRPSSAHHFLGGCKTTPIYRRLVIAGGSVVVGAARFSRYLFIKKKLKHVSLGDCREREREGGREGGRDRERDTDTIVKSSGELPKTSKRQDLMKSRFSKNELRLIVCSQKHIISERTCREWFQKFKNGDCDVEDKDRSGRQKIYEDVKLEELLEKGSSQTQKELALSARSHSASSLASLKLLRMILRQDIAPSDYHLFRSMAHVLSEQRFTSYEDIKNWIHSWKASKDKEFFRLGIRTLPERAGASRRNMSRVRGAVLVVLMVALAVQLTAQPPTAEEAIARDRTARQAAVKAGRLVATKPKWGFFGTIFHLILEQVNDTKSAYNQISDLVNSQFSDNDPTTTLPPDSNATTRAPKITRAEFLKILDRNLKGLQRLRSLEWREAMKDSMANLRGYKNEIFGKKASSNG
ncbi:Mariner Mos1 transposase [Eumeta japonica]|uniref:Mariner Mos1 transposase n=1 Tax=Eumeta variegata TaxID=151549 RepID=A0A4C1XEW4_EUMVA|nr:Mariner Mos1 transposase [Eumeta japonica]